MMKRARGEDGSNSVDRISELPQGILQQILYHLSQDEAVRTSILSKSWRYNWCTRPNLDFSDRSFFKGRKQYFLSVVDETLQRYRDQRLCIEEFHLCISLDDSDPASSSFLEKWIPTLATTNKGMKKFSLSIRSEQGSVSTYPPSVVFEAELLQDLQVEELTLDRKAIDRIIHFKHLKKLHLLDVCIEAEIFQNIISRCPLIEDLFVEDCRGLRKIEVNDLHCLKDLYFTDYEVVEGDEECCSIEVYPPSLETIKVNYGNLRLSKGAVFCNLNHLYLCGVELLLDRLSSCKFPSLEYLSIVYCEGLRGIKLFMDAPNMVDFSYQGDFIPSISFASTSTEWKSDINLHLRDAPSLWSVKLRKLLKSLSQFQIFLWIIQEDDDGDGDGDSDVDGDGDGDGGGDGDGDGDGDYDDDNGDGDADADVDADYDYDGDGDGDGDGDYDYDYDDGGDGDGDGGYDYDDYDDYGDDDDEHIIQENINLVQDKGCDKPVVVETLQIQWCSFSDIPSLFNGALCVCRPRNIGPYYRRSWEKEVVCAENILMQRESGDDQDDQLRQLWLQDLEEVRMEIYDTKGREYHPTTLSELPNYQENRYFSIRFALKWKQRC